MSEALSDVDLLRIECDTLWTADDRGRLLASRGRSGWPAPHVAIGASRGARTVAIGSDVPVALEAELRAAVAADPLPTEPADEPDALRVCERLLRDALGPVERLSGPAYVIERPLEISCDAEIITSTDEVGSTFHNAVPEGFDWTQEEWRELMSGEVGPWAMCAVGGTPVSLCHCSRMSDDGVEAGLWTLPAYRGRGYGAAATAAWASLLVPSGRHVFYSTNAENLSSQQVAARLNLRPIGWRWMLSPSAPRPA